MKIQKFRFDDKRQQVRGCFHELKRPDQRMPPMYNLCSLDHYNFRADGRRRSVKEQTNLLGRLYTEKIAQILEKQEHKNRLAEEERKRVVNDQAMKDLGMPINVVMQQWIDQEVSPYSKPVTVREYMRTCTLYLEIVGDHAIRKFRKHHATNFQSGLQKHGLRESGIRKHQTHLQVFLNWAYSEEHLEKPVRLNKVQVVQQGPVIYTRSEVEILQAAIDKALAESVTRYQKQCITNHLRAFMTARHAVLRCGEILALPLRHFLIDEAMLRITAVPEIGWMPKTRQERIVPLNPELRSFLETDLRDRGSDELWFLDNGQGGRAYASNSQLTQVFRRYVKRARLEQPGRKPLHALRSTGITGMLSAGGKLDFVMRIAGHSNPQTTLNHYVRAENFDLRDTVNLLSNPPENGFTGGR